MHTPSLPLQHLIDHAPNVSALIRGARLDLPRGVTLLLWLPASMRAPAGL